MGANITNCESVGGGQIAKTCNNMALAIQMISVAEALAMSKRLGLCPNKMASIMSKASSRCWSVDTYPPIPNFNPTPVPADNNYDGGFANELLVKDLNIAIQAANDSGANIALGRESLKIYQDMIEQGMNRKDFSIIYEELLK